MVNYSADDIRLRTSFDVTVSYESDLEEAEQALLAAARDTDGVMRDGGEVRIVASTYPLRPVVQIQEFADSGIHLTLRYWLKEPYYKKNVATELSKNVWREFGERNIEIPYPHRHVVFDEDRREGSKGLEKDRDG